MLSLRAIFWIFLIFFSLIGALRGWAKEIVATAGLVLSLFTLRTFGPTLLGALSLADVVTIAGDPNRLYRQQFWLLTAIHLFIAFVSYQGPTLSPNVGTRLRRSENVQDKLLGGIVGFVNGYLIVGTLISFLEYRVQRNPATTGLEFLPLLPTEPYPFDPSVIVRPFNDLSTQIFQVLPLTLFSGNPLILPLLLVALFLVVLIVVV